MYSKKTRIISFLMAFLLIFTFAFINPLTTSKSYAAVPVLTVAAQRIITGVLISSGIVIKGVSDLTDTQKQNMVEDFANYVWWSMSLIEKASILSLEIINNVVNIPIELYNKIKTKAQEIAVPSNFSSTLEAQGINTIYSGIASDDVNLPSLSFPIYENDWENVEVEYEKYDMSQAQPFFVYEGSPEDTALSLDNVTVNVFNYDNSNDNIPNDIDIGVYSTTLSVSPDLSSYRIPTDVSGNYLTRMKLMLRTYNSYGPNLNFVDNANNIEVCELIYASASSGFFKTHFLYNYIMNVYFIKNSSSSDSIGILYEYLDDNGNVLYQRVKPAYLNDRYNTDAKGLNDLILNNATTVINPDMTFEVEETPAPVITNTDATETILTLPSDLATSVGVTSTQVNVGSADVPDNPDVPDTPNTETIDNINTNVGELVTGGEIGEQVNTNIGTVEGLHGEITEQVDFGAVFDTISEYISALDISSVTWFPVAVASFLVPFLPVISLGLILFFIDRVLNGGA